MCLIPLSSLLCKAWEDPGPTATAVPLSILSLPFLKGRETGHFIRTLQDSMASEF